MFVFNLCEETISRTDECQPRPKYIFNKCGTNIYFFLLYRGSVHHHHRILKMIYLLKGLYAETIGGNYRKLLMLKDGYMII